MRLCNTGYCCKDCANCTQWSDLHGCLNSSGFDTLDASPNICVNFVKETRSHMKTDKIDWGIVRSKMLEEVSTTLEVYEDLRDKQGNQNPDLNLVGCLIQIGDINSVGDEKDRWFEYNGQEFVELIKFKCVKVPKTFGDNKI